MTHLPPTSEIPVRRSTLLRLMLAIGIVLLCYIIATPRNGGPDEPSHVVFSAALIRGERVGQPVPSDPSLRAFQVPAFVGEPSPSCWALQPFVPVGCASLQSDSTGLVTAATTAANYPPWTYLLPSIASLIPHAHAYTYLARLLMAAAPFVLVAASLRQIWPSGRGIRIAVLLGVTPIAWFSMTIVNPSAVAIAGALALWVGIVTLSSSRTSVLAVTGWVCVVLARRDGPLWATLIVLTLCVALSTDPRTMWSALSRWARWVIPATALLAVLTGLSTGARGLNLLLLASPIALLAIGPALSLYRRTRPPWWVMAVLAGALSIAVIGVIDRFRPGGLEIEVLRLIMSNTGEHLRQLVGVLGWLDTPVPTVAVFAFWAAVGALLAVAALEQPRIAVAGLMMVSGAVVTAWALELGQGADYGQYWQGRYTLPFSIGLPLLLSIRGAWGRVSTSPSLDSLAPALGVVTWLIWNLGFAAALQRWGVGLAGSWLPWDWNTWDSPLQPWLLLILHSVATAWLVSVTTRTERRRVEVPEGQPA